MNLQYESCNIIEHGFDAQIDSINLCCRVSKENITSKVVLLPDYKGEKIDWQNFFKITDNLKNMQKQGQTVPQCKGCIYLQNRIWDDEHYINTININNWIKCNANCIYCDRKEYKNKKEYKIYPIIKSLIQNNYLKKPVDITIAGGEPTLTSDFDKTLNLLIKHKFETIRVLTNAIKYNKNIEKGLKEGLVNILVSTDSGTRNIYKKIKLTDKHDIVWKNITKYAKVQHTDSLVKTKYIILPYFNNTKEEISEYIKRNIEANVKTCCIDIEIQYFYHNCNNGKFLQEMNELFLYAVEYAKDSDLQVIPFDRMQLAINKINNIS